MPTAGGEKNPTSACATVQKLAGCTLCVGTPTCAQTCANRGAHACPFPAEGAGAEETQHFGEDKFQPRTAVTSCTGPIGEFHVAVLLLLQVSAVPTTTATEAYWQQLFCGAFTAEVFERAANNMLPAQNQVSSSSRTSPPAPAAPGTSGQAATPSALSAAGASGGASGSSSTSVLKQLRTLLCSDPAQKLLEEAQKYYPALLSGQVMTTQEPGAGSSSSASMHAPVACWQQQLELFEQVVGMMGHKLSQKLGGVPQALKLLESSGSRHSAQVRRAAGSWYTN